MLETIAIILIILWLLGLVSGYTMGNFIYILLVIAIVLFLVRLVSGRECSRRRAKGRESNGWPCWPRLPQSWCS